MSAFNAWCGAGIGIALTIGAAFVFYATSPIEQGSLAPSLSPDPATEQHTPPLPTQEPAMPILTEPVLHDVPFIAQAPLAQWNDPMFQDGCEEASILMAAVWAGAIDPVRISSPDLASKEIIMLSEYQLEYDGEFRDRSANDTAHLMKEYFNYAGIRFETNITADDIIREITNGNIVIVPANGQVLGNPNFTSPGPERHMLVIRGWDPITGEFITNDPGTRRGEAYRYDKTVLYNAIRDYRTGYHVPIESVKKTMIVITRQ